eukprot:CAMPEP_0201140188 /NCGR_PEP_ID=MMETSP0851-20130426/1737_1 /ASSEMBLY_ACC=CAM_ASM_000631 /TAXON_ID=183588 /ORGANISM="Pseudo-nitzschia fraudulenta, Strain WWA7" /LENGTH=376 /DNA_ID=CAMNT_0047412575 /DNA_START=74 /DNA_END=1204 /DNA_ORIENTATION=-
MANISDVDPPDPSDANIPTIAQSTNTPVVHSAKTSSILTKNDGETRYFVIVVDDDANTPRHDGSPTILTNNATIPPDSTIGALSNPSSAARSAQKGSTKTDQVLPNYGNTNTNTDTTMTITDGVSTDEWDISPWNQVPSPASDIVTNMLMMDHTTDTDTTTDNTTNNNTNTNTNTNTDTNDNSNNLKNTPPPMWTPIKIGWNSNVPADDSIHDSTVTNNPVDDAKISQCPFIAKLSSFIFIASKTHNSSIAIKTSKSNCVLQLRDLHLYWSVNDFKHHFASTTSNRRVQFTLWISMPSSLTLWTLKQPILGHLREADIYIDEQTAPMDQIETTFLGWFCKRHHPDLCHIPTLELAINDALQAHFDDNKDDLLAFVL